MLLCPTSNHTIIRLFVIFLSVLTLNSLAKENNSNLSDTIPQLPHYYNLFHIVDSSCKRGIVANHQDASAGTKKGSVGGSHQHASPERMRCISIHLQG